MAAADPGRVPAGSRLGAFVGIAAYEAAGGTVTRDLFSGDEDGFMDDAAFVRRLAIEKLEAKAEELRPGWAWTRAMLDPDYGFTAEYARLRPRPAEFPPAIAGGIQTIEERLAKLEELPDNAWTDAPASEAEDLQARHDELIETTEAEAIYADEDRARAGVIVTIGDDGDFRLYEGLVERAERPAHASNGAAEITEDSDEAFVDADHTAPPRARCAVKFSRLTGPALRFGRCPR